MLERRRRLSLAQAVASKASGLSPTSKAAVLLCLDSALVPLALAAALMLQGAQDAMATVFAVLLMPVLALVGVGLATSLLLGAAHARLRDYDVSAAALTGAHATCLTLAAFVLLGAVLPSGTLIVFGMVLFLAAFLGRILMRHALMAIYKAAQRTTPVIIYGAGMTGRQLTAALRSDDTIVPVAFVDDNSALHGKTVAGLRVYPALKAPVVARSHNARRVILATPSLPAPKRAEIAKRLQSAGLEVQALPSFSQLVGEQLRLDQLVPIAPHTLLHREKTACNPNLVSDSYKGRAILVSGAGGSIGSELCRQVLAAAPRKLILFELSEHALFQIERSLRQITDETVTHIVPVLGSITDPRLVRTVMREHDIDVVLHAAAYKHVPIVETNILAGLANNVLGTHTLAREAMAAGVERFILISSDKAVRPSNVMGATKRLAELLVQDLAARSERTRFAAVRFGNVLGSSGSVIEVFQEQIAAGGPITLTDQHATRYFMTVEEAVHLVLVAGAHATGGEIFVLDMGEPLKIRDLARKMIASAGYSVRDAENPDGDIAIELIGLRPGEKVHEERMTDGATGSGAHPSILKVEAPSLSEIELAGIVRSIRTAVGSGGLAEADAIVRRVIADGQIGENPSVAMPRN